MRMIEDIAAAIEASIDRDGVSYHAAAVAAVEVINRQNMVHRAVLGSAPDPSFFAILEMRDLGSFIGGHLDEWHWDEEAVMGLSLDEAYSVFVTITI